VSEFATQAAFGVLVRSTLHRPLSLDDRARALHALAELADLHGMQDHVDAAIAAVEAVKALDAAQLRLFDLQEVRS
jgi:hypothetical protein